MASKESLSSPESAATSSVFLNPPESAFCYEDSEVYPLVVPAETTSHDETRSPVESTTISASSVDDAVNLAQEAGTRLADSGATPFQAAAFPPLNSPNPNADKQAQSHWFYCKKVEGKKVWFPFSLLDSLHLEEECLKSNHAEQTVIATDGGRYDVYLQKRIRCAVYWEEDSAAVRRATWFYRREGERAFVPYPEHFAEKLEEEYHIAVSTNTWHRRLEFPKGETVVFHNPEVIVHYQTSFMDSWEGSPEGLVKPSVVKRGMDDYEQVEDGEAIQIDHLVFVVHGIGDFCDLKFRTLPEVVNDFRSISGTLLKTHFKSHVTDGKIGRVEFLPASWHTFLHGEATGIDEKLKPITLKSIPKLRYFANDAILDVLFYTSPFYCQAIINQVGSEINRLYNLFISRNPSFQGNVSLAGHSLGSVILFDILLHQEDLPKKKEKDFQTDGTVLSPSTGSSSNVPGESIVESEMNGKVKNGAGESSDRLTEMPRMETVPESVVGPRRRQSETTINYIVGLAGTGHPYVIYPRINFKPTCFFALGSPIAMFLTVRGLEIDWKGFQFPNCPAFFNIFHPYDPVAYRIEPLIDPSITLKPVLIPHHKGRKRMHLEIKESLSRVGSDLKQKVYDSLLFSWNTINDLARTQRPSTTSKEPEENEGEEPKVQNYTESAIEFHEFCEEDVVIGNLNGGRRIDYVLQEKPLESFNEYLFALGSHTCYWESEDTVLLLLKEIYGSYGISSSYQYSELPRSRSSK